MSRATQAAYAPDEAADPLRYPAIGDYAAIGDCRTVALISRDGSLDWLCLPHYSSPAVFAAILDNRRGGRFAIRPVGCYCAQRRYRERTNVLETTFTTDSGSVRLTDCMPVLLEPRGAEQLQPQREVLRMLEGLAGSVELEVQFEPRPDYARASVRLQRRGALGWFCDHRENLLVLRCAPDLDWKREGDTIRGRVRLTAGSRCNLSLSYVRHEIAVFPGLEDEAEARLDATIRWWRGWSAQCQYDGPYAGAVERSALALKLLNYELSGAVVAAPTASLPEKIGGVRNWDYRFCWLRDAALTLRAFVDLGYYAEAGSFLGWLLHSTRRTQPELQVLYDVHGETQVDEHALEHLEGYRGSRPVRIGNGAWRQRQLDVYGEVVLAASDYRERGGGSLDRYEQRLLKGFAEVVCRDWDKPDQGIWEVRSEGRHHTFSKLMCWAALDCLIRMHANGQIPLDDEAMRTTRTAIHSAIEQQAYNTELGSYVGTFGGCDLDASVLLLARYGFIGPNHPRMLSTWRTIRRALDADGLLYRYAPGGDGLPPGEGAFLITSFWAVDYLARAGRHEEAVRRFERAMGCANDLGLMSEEVEVGSGELLGNFPQAFSHVGLITAALSLQAHAPRTG